jgi:hypothetical protein
VFFRIFCRVLDTSGIDENTLGQIHDAMRKYCSIMAGYKQREQVMNSTDSPGRNEGLIWTADNRNAGTGESEEILANGRTHASRPTGSLDPESLFL